MFVSSDVDARLSFDETGKVALPSIVRVTDFGDESVKEFAESFAAAKLTKQPIIPIVIDSIGGEVYSMLAMADIIMASSVIVATVVMGKAMSAAAALFSCGTEGYRFVSPNSVTMIHDVSHSSEYKKVEEVRADTYEVERLNTLMYQLMAKNCGKPADYFQKLVNDRNRSDWYLTPTETVKHNLANHVGVPEIIVRVKVDFEMVLAPQRSMRVKNSKKAV